MSIKVMSWVWDHSNAAGAELLLLLAIADQANDDGRDAWPSIKTLAQRTRLDERTVRRVLKRLARSGHIIVRPGGGRRSNHYDVIMTRQTDELSTPLADRHPGQNATPGRSPGHPGRTARAPLAQLCQASPDTAMPSDPSWTPPPARRARSQAVGRANSGRRWRNRPGGRRAPRRLGTGLEAEPRAATPTCALGVCGTRNRLDQGRAHSPPRCQSRRCEITRRRPRRTPKRSS